MFLTGAQVFAQEASLAKAFSKKDLSKTGVLLQENTIALQPLQKEKKSVAKAFFLSLLLPGTGEAYIGETVYTKIFMSIEVVGWGLFVANRLNISKREEDSKVMPFFP